MVYTKPESFLKTKIDKILREFKIKSDKRIPFRRPGLMLINKDERKCHPVDYAVLADHRVKSKESKKIENTWILQKS